MNGTGTDDSTVTFRATQTIANGALDGLTFDPTADFDGGATIMIMTNDLGNSGAGGAMQDVDSINITVDPVNDAPEVRLENGLAGLDENSVLTSPTKVADIVVTDDAIGTNVLSLSGADSNLFQIIGTELFVVPGANFDFETQSRYDVSIQIDDITLGTNPEDSVAFSLNIFDVNEAPTVTVTPIVNSLSRVDDTTSAIEVATIFINDDALGTEVVTLSGANANNFEIVNDRLLLKSGTDLNLIDAMQEVTIEVHDPVLASGTASSATFSVEILDVAPAPLPTNSPTNSPTSDESTSNENEDIDSDPVISQVELPGLNPANENSPTTQPSELSNNVDQTDTLDQTNLSQIVEQVVRAVDADNLAKNALYYGDLDQRVVANNLEHLAPLFDQITITQTPLALTLFQEFSDSTNPQLQLQLLGQSTSAIATTSLSVGYVIWLLRGGSLFAGLLSSLPAWTALDPLSVLTEDQESLSDIAGH